MKKNFVLIAVFLLGLLASTLALYANPTGAPLVYYAVEPCRFLDTRVSAPVASGVAIDSFVRGSALQASDGALQSDCNIPPDAQAVKVNFTVVNPTSTGYLKINGTGSVGGPVGSYCRMAYRMGEIDSNEMTVSLCNIATHPFPHQPCAYGGGRYADFQIANIGASLTSVHIVGDVVGYFAAIP